MNRLGDAERKPAKAGNKFGGHKNVKIGQTVRIVHSEYCEGVDYVDQAKYVGQFCTVMGKVDEGIHFTTYILRLETVDPDGTMAIVIGDFRFKCLSRPLKTNLT